MRMKMTILGLALTIALCISGTARAEAAPDAEGFIPLFNGKDLEGWKIFRNPEGFKVVDGAIRCEFRGGGEIAYYDVREFGDFVLKVEWRVSAKGNSGVFLRTPQNSEPWNSGYEVQISNEQPPRDDAHCTGSLYGYVAVDPRPDETPEQWRSYEITCTGPKIRVVVDDQEVISYDQSTEDETQDKPLKGYIGIQDSHSGATNTWVEYRSIRIKPLD